MRVDRFGLEIHNSLSIAKLPQLAAAFIIEGSLNNFVDVSAGLSHAASKNLGKTRNVADLCCATDLVDLTPSNENRVGFCWYAPE